MDSRTMIIVALLAALTGSTIPLAAVKTEPAVRADPFTGKDARALEERINAKIEAASARIIHAMEIHEHRGHDRWRDIPADEI